MRIRPLFLLLYLALAVGNASAQTSPSQTPQSKTNLTTILYQLSEKYDAKISFSPDFTNKVFPKNPRIDGGVEIALTRVLGQTGLAFKKLNNTMYYIYRTKRKRIPVKAKPKKQVPEPDTLQSTVQRMYTVVLPLADSILPAHNNEAIMSKIGMQGLPNITHIVERPVENLPLPLYAVKSNLLYNATASINLGVEIGLASKWTIDVSGSLKQWSFSENLKMKHWLIQPELRYWPCQRFSGHFYGAHAHYAQFDGSTLPWGIKLNHRHQAWLVGVGIDYGYHYVLGNRWGLEVEIGAGYAYIEYDKFSSAEFGEKINSGHRNYFGPTKLAATLVFVIK